MAMISSHRQTEKRREAQSRIRRNASSTDRPSAKVVLLRYGAILCLGSLLGALAAVAGGRAFGDGNANQAEAEVTSVSAISPQLPAMAGGGLPTVDELMALTDEELGKVDPLIVNLAVARGIPEFADLDVDRYSRTLDEWAATIRFDTERHWYRFQNDPAAFNDSEAEYRICWLASDINAVFKIDYDLADFDAADPANLFLNGLIDRKLGTCVSMPMLYVALGWRLGYPIKLVSVPIHLFARWDDGEARINIEATGYGAELADEFYEAEYLVSRRCKERGAEMASLASRETLAMLLLSRAGYWAGHGDHDRAVQDSLRANLLSPTVPLAVTELMRNWTRRTAADDYFAHVVEHLAEAGSVLTARIEAQQGQPVPKVVFTEQGPVEVLINPMKGLIVSQKEE